MPKGIYQHKPQQGFQRGHPNYGFQKGHPNYHTKKSKKQISKTLKEYWKSHLPPSLGKKYTQETREKMRKAAFGYAKIVCDIICPRIGRNEKRILDTIEQKLKITIIRQYECLGYFIDGYILEMRIAIEVDEKPKNTIKDIERESMLKKELNCEFIRIKDYD